MMRRRPGFGPALAGLLVAGLVVRLAYVVTRAATDPMFARPVLDGAYYLDWARSLAAGQGSPPGAFYLAPLYPHVLRVFLKLFGEDFGLLYYAQQLVSVGTAGLLALAGRRLISPGSGLAAAALFLLYHPTAFFASQPIGETLAILLLTLGLALVTLPGPRSRSVSGLATGVAALARPNLLLVPLFWALGDAARRRWTRVAWIGAGVFLAVLPVLVRNWSVSGHAIPISSNAGITLYHGNGPGAAGTFVQPVGFTGELATQRDEATRLAARHAGKALDPVEADRWWGRQALALRLRDPAGTALLLLRRSGLTLANAELALAYAPGIDRTPLRWAMPVPFCAILGLAAAGVALRGFRRSGGWPGWGAVVACAAVPLAFYVSSRYRLPVAAMLCLPAGAGLAGLLGGSGGGSRKALWGWTAALVVCSVSLTVPAREDRRKADAIALAARGDTWREAGNFVNAESDLRAARELDPDSANVLYNLGLLLEQTGRTIEARECYTRALEIRPGYGHAAASLGRVLNNDGHPQQAIPILEQALRDNPFDGLCWTALVVARTLSGDLDGAAADAGRARELGVELDPDMLELLQRLRRREAAGTPDLEDSG